MKKLVNVYDGQLFKWDNQIYEKIKNVWNKGVIDYCECLPIAYVTEGKYNRYITSVLATLKPYVNVTLVVIKFEEVKE